MQQPNGPLFKFTLTIVKGRLQGEMTGELTASSPAALLQNSMIELMSAAIAALIPSARASKPTIKLSICAD